MPYSKRLFIILLGFGLLIGAAACSNDAPQAWSGEDLLKHADVMGNAGTAYAVHDICMPMIESDAEISSRVSLTIGAKRYTQLLEMASPKKRSVFVACSKERNHEYRSNLVPCSAW